MEQFPEKRVRSFFVFGFLDTTDYRALIGLPFVAKTTAAPGAKLAAPVLNWRREPATAVGTFPTAHRRPPILLNVHEVQRCGVSPGMSIW